MGPATASGTELYNVENKKKRIPFQIIKQGQQLTRGMQNHCFLLNPNFFAYPSVFTTTNKPARPVLKCLSIYSSVFGLKREKGNGKKEERTVRKSRKNWDETLGKLDRGTEQYTATKPKIPSHFRRHRPSELCTHIYKESTSSFINRIIMVQQVKLVSILSLSGLGVLFTGLKRKNWANLGTPLT